MDSTGTLQRSVINEHKKSNDATQPIPPERLKRASLKLRRSKERDWKQEMGQRDAGKADSLPSPALTNAVPTLVESGSRFLSLSSRLKSRAASEEEAQETDEQLPPGRVSFHQTFSMLINMGNVEKGCRRAISREEQVWQNELKDLIWLELQARLAGRSLAAQDAHLCAARAHLPAIVQRVRTYRFVNPNPCTDRSRRLTIIAGSTEDLSVNSPDAQELSLGKENTDDMSTACVSFDCAACSNAVGAGMREVRALLEACDAALALYPSSSAARADQPLLADAAFQDRIRAMCLWYNVALHMRMKMLSIRRILRMLQSKQRRRLHHPASTDSTASRKSFDSPKPSQVRFDVSNNTTSDSNNSDSSAQSDGNRDNELRKDQQKDQSEDQSKEQTEAHRAESENDPKTPLNNGVAGSPRTENGVNENEKTETEGERTENSAKVGREGGGGCEGIAEEADLQEEKKDVVDGGPLHKLGGVSGTGDTTPEIVVSETYDTSDTSASCESGYASAGERDAPSAADALQLGDLYDLTRMRLLGRTACSPYREYYYEMLKTQGVRRCMTFMNKMCNSLLSRVYFTLLEPVESPDAFVSEDPSEMFGEAENIEKSEEAKEEDIKNASELRRYGCWSAECTSMRLPSYRSHFLLLSSICMEAVHDYLSLRLTGRPERPSCLTVKQLIHDLKEGLDIATSMRASFARNVQAALRNIRAATAARRDLLLLLNTFDATVDAALEQYLSYLLTMSATEALPRAWLTAEWAFTARLAARAPHAADLAPAAFTDMACNQLQMVLKRFEQKLQKVMEYDNNSDPIDHEETRYIAYAMCRETQSIYASEREPTLQAAQWARALAARLPPPHGHLRLKLFNNLFSIRDCIVQHTCTVFELTRFETRGDIPREVYDSISPRIRELLLHVYKLGFELHREMYKFAVVPLKPPARPRAPRPASLQPARPATPLPRRRPDTVLVHESYNPIHKELHRLVKEASPSEARAAESPGRLRTRLLRSESVGEEPEGAIDGNMFEKNFQKQNQSSLEALLGGTFSIPERPEPAAEGAKAGEREGAEEREGEKEGEEVGECQEAVWARRVARAVVDFAKYWMQFVVERCDRGRGLRPRWASQGLEFLMLACEPCNTRHLSEAEFEQLKQLMDGCISHVVGSRPAALRGAPEPAAAPSPTPPHRQRHRIHSPLSNASSKEAPTPPTPPGEMDHPFNFANNDFAGHSKRVSEAVRRLDGARDQQLRGRKAVGRAVDAAVASYEPKLRQVSFKWQRGLKIGAGTFGKVYTVVNTESGQVLAMKEVAVCAGAGARLALLRAANELRVLEGARHPHLVRYHGCELHREELLLFMELCVEGSLEALVATSGALAEPTVRRYTKQLVSAVLELHSRSIAHRDIKSGNIFLTNEGHCLKLGDFGCAVKIRANTTAPGELQGFVGTQAYMAPEVFTKSSGHGRAADIWSLGCVVTEMASGKRPFSEYDSNYQIMFVVGMGGRPGVPEALSEEGRQFCAECLTHEPDLRPRAEALALHHFLMVKSDEDCKCEPGDLIT